MRQLQDIIELAFDNRADLSPGSADPKISDAVEQVIAELDAGRLRAAEKINGQWVTNQWVKKAVLLSFRLRENQVMPGGSTQYYDKVPTKFASCTSEEFAAGGFRVVPPAVARRGCY